VRWAWTTFALDRVAEQLDFCSGHSNPRIGLWSMRFIMVIQKMRQLI
jgi:hypothetical protein